jgi:hypothetical protein
MFRSSGGWGYIAKFRLKSEISPIRSGNALLVDYFLEIFVVWCLFSGSKIFLANEMMSERAR